MNLLAELSQSFQCQFRKPATTLLILLVLTLGIGSTSAVVTIVNSVLFEPLPFRSPDSLVMVWEEAGVKGRLISSLPNFQDWKTRNHVFESMAFARDCSATLRLDSEPIRIHGAEISEEFFAVLGIEPFVGRLIHSDDFRPDAPPVVVLSYGLWQRHFGGEAELVGRPISVDGSPRTLIGVLPPHVTLDQPLATQKIEVLWPIDPNAPWNIRAARLLRVIARLRLGVTLEQAASEMTTLARTLATEYPEANERWTTRVESLHELMVGDVRLPLLILLGAAALVLFVACTNVANVLAVQTSRRSKEFAIRTAMGALRARLFGQLLIESVPVIVLGAVGGLFMAHWISRGFAPILPTSIVGVLGLGSLGSMIAVTTLVSTVTVVLIQLLPLLELSNIPLAGLLGEGSGGAGQSRRGQRARSTMVILEVALSLILLIGAALLIKSFIVLSRIDLGFNPKKTLTVQFEVPEVKMNEHQEIRRIFDDILGDLERDPRVRFAAVANYLPLKGGNFTVAIGLDTQTWLDWQIDLRATSAEYFSAMNIPLLKGRDFSSDDNSAERAVVILNRTAADRLWPGQDPLGKYVFIKWGERVPREVVGIVGDVRHVTIDVPPRPEAYLPYSQMPVRPMNLVVQTSVEPLALANDVRTLIRSTDQDIIILNVVSMESLVSSTLAKPRLFARLLSAFAVIACVLAVTGSYGVTSFIVSARMPEYGIRIALGAQRKIIVKTIILQGSRLIGLGVVLGIAGAYYLTSFLANLLFEVSPLDPLTFTTMPVALAAVALLANYVPARRATRANPIDILRVH